MHYQAELQLTRHDSLCWGGQAFKQPITHVFNTAIAYFRHVCHETHYMQYKKGESVCSSMYLDKEDLYTIIELLNNDPEIAFIKYNGKNKLRKWIAVENLQDYDLERYCLWHIPSGPLPLKVYRKDIDEFIINPFEGWEERTPSGNNCCPYFGAGHVGIIWLNNCTGD